MTACFAVHDMNPQCIHPRPIWNAFMFVSFSFGFGLLFGQAFGQDALVGILTRVDKAIDNPNDYAAWQHLLQSLPTAALESLRQHGNNTVAIGDDLELLVRRPALQRESEQFRISELDAARFTAFCEGRLGIEFQAGMRLLSVVNDEHHVAIECFTEWTKATQKACPRYDKRAGCGFYPGQSTLAASPRRCGLPIMARE